jgi:tRNA uridine 5-carboxymethylaminomethyl modification enzyme
MFTSRAEFRLHLRIDNADERLTPIAQRVGMAGEKRWALCKRKIDQKEKLRTILSEARIKPGIVAGVELGDDDRPTAIQWLRRPENRITTIKPWLEGFIGQDLVPSVLTTLETEAKYTGYIQQQERQVNRLRDSEQRPIPDGVSYDTVPGLSREIREKLIRVRPTTLGQASRIPGVTPAAVAVLDVYLNLSAHRR